MHFQPSNIIHKQTAVNKFLALTLINSRPHIRMLQMGISGRNP